VWVRLALSVLIGLPVAALIAWQSRRRLYLPFYYWIQGQPAGQTIAFQRAHEERDLPGIALKVKRIGKDRKVRFDPQEGAKLLAGDGKEIPYLEAHEDGRILVRNVGAQIKAIHFSFHNPPPRPDPYEPQEPLEEQGAAASASDTEEFDWGFGKPGH
ncbi:MAG: hypothetical protein IT210_24920, partial [Armatimonadetes bacterium]|nr:hypothetical protein [Armatimonadota bacterium]